MLMDEVWGVYTGPYYEQDVLCVCPTKEDAEQIASRCKADGTREAEVHALTFVTADTPKIATLSMDTMLWDDGSETSATERLFAHWPYEASEDDLVPVKALWRRTAWMTNYGHLTVFGTDHERVREMYRERREQLLADPQLRKTPWGVFYKNPWGRANA